MLKADLHIHTRYSMDCNSSIEEIITRCRETGINCVAVSDHDSIEGALEMQKAAPFPVIVAEEVLTPHGEIMGMFVKERVPSGLAVEEVISRLKAQGALVCLPHPFDTFRGLRLEDDQVDELGSQADLVEVFNARSPFLRCSTRAQAFARKFGLPGTAGSDAHSRGEMGYTYIEMPEFSGPADFLVALRQGKIHRHKSPFLARLRSTLARVRKSL